MQFKISIEKNNTDCLLIRHELETGIMDLLNKGTLKYINADYQLMIKSIKRTCDNKERSIVAETPTSITFFVNERLL